MVGLDRGEPDFNCQSVQMLYDGQQQLLDPRGWRILKRSQNALNDHRGRGFINGLKRWKVVYCSAYELLFDNFGVSFASEDLSNAGWRATRALGAQLWATLCQTCIEADHRPKLEGRRGGDGEFFRTSALLLWIIDVAGDGGKAPNCFTPPKPLSVATSAMERPPFCRLLKELFLP